MITAIVFVNADVARIPEVAEEIAAIEGVSEVYSVTGQIDLIALVRVRHHEDVAGVVADRDEAFRRFLNPGMPGYVDRYAAPLRETIRVVTEAGGGSVIAHAWGRRRTRTPDEAALADLAASLHGVRVERRVADVADPVTGGQAVEDLAERVEVLPDRLLLYTADGEETVAKVHERGLQPIATLVRRSTLEDVFLRLTGRTLVD